MKLPIWGYIAFVAGLIILAEEFRIHVLNTQLSAARVAYAELQATYAEASAKAQADIRAIEHKWQSIADKEVANAREQLSIAESDAAAAGHDADSLRAEVRRLRSRIATADATTAGRGKAEQSAFGVLAELFEESVRRNQVLAKEADRVRVTGTACERIYDGMRNEPHKKEI